ncbi:MAG: O-antigen ligase family protein [Alphaproteobacteria bacterium]|jgi:exopolysaccharide production protein ExoQ|nr:O-antigen ligase family protein [Alphaproteobacteria bacterium]
MSVDLDPSPPSNRTLFGPQVVFPGLAFTLPVLSVLGPSMIWILAAVAALIGGALSLIQRRKTSLPSYGIPGALVLLVIWAAITMQWSPALGRAQHVLTNIVMFIVGGLFLISLARTCSSREQRHVGKALIAGFTIAISFILIEFILDAPVSRFLNGDEGAGSYGLAFFNRASGIIALLAWTLVLVVQRQTGTLFAVCALLACIVVLAMLNSSAPLLALLVASLAAGLVLAAPGLAIWVIGFATVISIAVLPMWTIWAPDIAEYLREVGHVDQGINHRLAIWEFAADRVIDKPFLGWGLDAARAIPGGRETFDLLVNIDGDTTPGEYLPLHPHNGFLQVWLELGLPGILLIGFITLAALRAINKYAVRRVEKACVAATCVSGILLFELSFGAWQGWWQASLWVAAALTIAVVTRPATPETSYSAAQAD